MAKYLYEVSFSGGRSNPEFHIFIRNVTELNAKAGDYAGISNLCVISHTQNQKTVLALCARGLKKSREDLEVVEITRKTLASPNSSHRLFQELIDRLYLPFDTYPNIV
ncbi:hypothetical protein K788_00002560 [Paraburkholderia caribensis MBA4]|uniref:Uncharacterized protein n=1 Tax=Paraburkholderia caribensis MBA4 TaxID=1323664 RepID=A0A0P0RIL0_9BURK|nr:hypothetical protein [Paraburkholderia caribensis]ALL68464.1 hypothetical protein K788_00002560 [Paraburkholderia caribensis MBA4]